MSVKELVHGKPPKRVVLKKGEPYVVEALKNKGVDIIERSGIPVTFHGLSAKTLFLNFLEKEISALIAEITPKEVKEDKPSKKADKE